MTRDLATCPLIRVTVLSPGPGLGHLGLRKASALFVYILPDPHPIPTQHPLPPTGQQLQLTFNQANSRFPHLGQSDARYKAWFCVN